MRRYFLTIDFMVVGFTSVAGQTLFIRELEQLFYGNELCLGVIFAGWLLFSGIGCIIGRRVRKNIFLLLQLSLWLLFPLEYTAVHTVKPVLGIGAGELIPLFQMIWISLLIFAPISIVLGLLFIQGCKWWNNVINDSVRAVSQVYRIDAFGDLLGGCIFSIILVNFYSINNIFVMGIINLIFVFILSQKKWMRATTIILLGLSIWGLNKTEEIERIALSREYPGYALVGIRNSIYGNLVTVKAVGANCRSPQQYSVYQNGVLNFTYPTVLRAEEVAHLPMLQVREAKNILLLGGNMEVAKELLKYPVEEVHCVEIDKKLGELWDSFLVLEDSRLKTHLCDGRKFVKGYRGEKIDLVIIDVGEPSTALVNRFYTIEFFQEVERILNPGGVLSFRIESNSNYLSRELLNYNGTIYRTLSEVFPNIILSPGEELWFFASHSSNYISDSAEELGQRISVPTKYVTKYFILNKFQPERIKYIKEKLDEYNAGVGPRRSGIFASLQHAAPLLNSDFHPIGYYYNNLITGSYFSGVFRRVFIRFLNIPFWVVLVIMSLVFFGIGLILRPQVFGIGVLGVSGIGLQLFIILSFEVLYGYVYHKIGIITAVFMLGVVSGAWIGGRGEIKLKAILGCMILYLLLFLGIIKFSIFNVGGQYIEPLHYIFPVISGLLIGCAWPVANKVLISRGESIERSSGVLNGADLFGSCIGSFLLSVLFIPIYGLYKSIILLVVLNFIALLFNIFHRISGA